MPGRDLFISHAGEDEAVARELRTALEGLGYTCWMAPDDIVGSQPWAEQIVGAIESTKLTIVLLSGSSLASDHVAREVSLAMSGKHSVLPVRLEPLPLGGALAYQLALIQRIDAFPAPFADHLSKIERMVESLAGKPSARPSRKSGGSKRHADEAATTVVRGPVAVGAVVGGFALTELLGEGGMARVFKAHQEQPSRDVAVKVIREDRAADPEYRARFLTESATLARLEHPSIVPVYAAGDSDGVLFIAMRLVDGSDLGQRLAKTGPLTLRETVELLAPIADAVDYAHEAGIVHRDLKPSNIVLDRGGRPYLTDFGLGKHIDGGAGISQPGVVVGTLDYMAPEQLMGRATPELASRVDVYAFACVAYACLTGHPPFPTDTPERLAVAHAGPVPSVRAERPALPAAVDTVLGAALAADPARRTATARDLVAGLRRALDAGTATATERVTAVAGAPRKLPMPAILGGVGALVVAAALAFAALGGGGGTKPSPSPVAVASPTPGPTATPTPAPATPTPRPAAPTPTPHTIFVADAIRLLKAATPAGVSCDEPTLTDTSALALAEMFCFVDDGSVSYIDYQIYPDLAALREDYASWLDYYGLKSDMGTECQQGDFEGHWYFQKTPNQWEGRYFCAVKDKVADVYWTDETTLILADLSGADGAAMTKVAAAWGTGTYITVRS